MTALDWSSDGAHWPHRQASRFVDAGGCRWHVQAHPGGAAQPVVWLLHGTGAAGHSWRGLVPLLAQRATLVVPDLPGHGFSGPLPGCTLVSIPSPATSHSKLRAFLWKTALSFARSPISPLRAIL